MRPDPLGLDIPYDEAFASFFAEAASVRGTEKTYHALFCHHLARAGVPLQSIARETRHDGAPVDVLVYAPSAAGRFEGNPDALLAAFEFKGGAYGNRNALNDTVRADGFSSDLDKLGVLRRRGVAAWFVCLEQAELGVALDDALRRRVAAQCAARGLGFAYHCHGEEVFLLARPGVELLAYPVSMRDGATSEARPAWHTEKGAICQHAAALAAEIEGSEDDYVFRLYHALRLAGYSAQQLSLETYFGFAREPKARMHKRPDLCIFEPSVAGRFNLYRHGSRASSHDALKLDALTAVIEVKGSLGASRKPERDFARTLDGDLEKLVRWREMIRAATQSLGVCRSTEPDYVLLAFDPRSDPLPAARVSELAANAARHGVGCAYRHLPLAGRTAPATRRGRSRGLGAAVRTADQRAGDTTPAGAAFYRLREVPRGRELATYLAAIFEVTGMDGGAVFPLTRFLRNVSGHVARGRIELVPGGHRLTQEGVTYFRDRYRRGPGDPLDPREVAAMSERIRTGAAPGWVPI